MENTTPHRYKPVTLRDAKTIWACATRGNMSYTEIAHMVGRTKQGVANFVYRVRHNSHPTFKVSMLEEAMLVPEPKPASMPPPEVSAADVIEQLERKADDARLEYVRLSKLVRELRAELKL